MKVLLVRTELEIKKIASMALANIWKDFTLFHIIIVQYWSSHWSAYIKLKAKQTSTLKSYVEVD